MEKQPILKVDKLKQHFRINSHFVVEAVDGISFDIHEGEIFALVGESGSGKSTVARSVMGFYTPTDGEVYFSGKLISGKKHRRERKDVCKNMQMIFQDSAAALNPRMTVEKLIEEPMLINHMYKSKDEMSKRIDELLEQVGLNSSYRKKYPSEISGGQRQRVSIARSIALRPKLIIADEPLAALDVSIQAQIVNLFMDLQKECGFAFLFIAHDLSIVKYISNRVGVLYKGKLVEMATTDELFTNPLHPYTKSLISAAPVPDPAVERNKVVLEFRETDFNGAGEMEEVKKGHFVLR